MMNYSLLGKQLKSLIEPEKDMIANMANMSALIFQEMENINWVGFYLKKGNELVLGPFQGKAACVAGWQNFVNTAKIHYWKELSPDVQVYGKTAVATYYFDISFKMADQTVNMWGRDMMTLIKEDGRWQVVADQFSVYSQ